MACQSFNLACSSLGDFAIYQGVTFNSVTFYYRDLDLSAYSPLGQIRDNYAESNGQILATFSFSPLTYGSVTVGTETFNATIIQPILTASETLNIPSTAQRSSEDAPFFAGLNGWVYDIKLIDTNQTVIVVRGFVEVIRDVSRV